MDVWIILVFIVVFIIFGALAEWIDEKINK